MTRDENLSSPEYLMASITKHINRGGLGDLKKARQCLDKLIEHERQKDYEDIVLLTDFEDALLGCVYTPEGAPIPCYDERAVIDQLTAQGMSEDEAIEYVGRLTDGMKVVWVNELELKDGPEKPGKPTLRICH